MSSEFEWQTEEDTDWEIEPDQPTETRSPWPARFLWVGLLLLLGVGAWYAYRQVDQRLSEVDAEVAADVLSSHNLLQEAAAQGDVDLALPLLSGRDPAWTEVRQALIAESRWLDRAGLGLRRRADGPESLAEITLDISPELEAAELVFTETYRTTAGEPVQLRQTAVYRRGSTRWLYSPPESAFWGEWRSREGERLTVIYPARDQAVVNRLAPALDGAIISACRQLADLNCPAELHVYVRFERDPEALANTADVVVPTQGLDFNFDLPTPTLVGLPVDEAGYEALRQGYVNKLLATVVAQLTDYDCCEQAAIFQALLDYQLSQLDLRAWPVTQADYERIIAERVGIDEFVGYSRVETTGSGGRSITSISIDEFVGYWPVKTADILQTDDGWLVYAAIDFLLHTSSDNTAAALQRRLDQGTDAVTWLLGLYAPDASGFSTRFLNNLRGGAILPRTLFLDNLRRRWWFYAYRQTLVSNAPLPEPLPAQDLQLLCTSNSLGDTTLYRYETAATAWHREHKFPGFALVSPTRGDEGIIISGLMDSPMLWREGTATPLLAEERRVIASRGRTDPTGRYLEAYDFGETETDFINLLVDLQQCGVNGCSSSPVNGEPVWSPNGQRTILAQTTTTNSRYRSFLFVDRVVRFGRGVGRTYLTEIPRLRLADATGQPLPDAEPFLGHAPFWIDDETYGYVQVDNSGAMGAMLVESVVVAGPDGRQTALDTGTVAALLPDGGRDEGDLWLGYVAAYPADPDLLLVVAFDRPTTTDAYLLAHDLRTRRTRFVRPLHFPASYSFGFSANGRYLMVAGHGDEPTPRGGVDFAFTRLLLIDPVQGETISYFVTLLNSPFIYDWSADGRWLALLAGDSLLLALPEENYVHVVPQQTGQNGVATCSSVVWVNGE